jgi:multidrug resistance efflux pump
VSLVKESRKELKDAYDKIEQNRQNLEKAKRDVENAQRSSSSQPSRLTMMMANPTVAQADASQSNKKLNEVYRLEEKLARTEKELDEATAVANEKYDKYTEALYRRVADECELTGCYLEYLKIQRKYHKQVTRQKRLDCL